MTLQIRPLKNFELLGTDVRLDRHKAYRAHAAINQPEWYSKRKIFCGGMILEQGEYEILSGQFAPRFTFTA